MCTTGAITLDSPDGTVRVFGFKTSDSPWTAFWHGRVHCPGGNDALAYGLVPQQGVNAGMNRKGLMLISSYFDYIEPTEKKENEADESGGTASSGLQYWQRDRRGIVQADALGACSNALEAVSYFSDAFRETDQPSIGGNHVIADEAGRIYVFEHCRGQFAVQNATENGYAARSNQSFLLFQEEQRQLEKKARKDRELRLEQAEAALQELKAEGGRLSDEEVVARLKALTAQHIGQGDDTGSICAHGVVKGRSNSPNPHHTLSAMIWSAHRKVMYYTIGNPCCSPWRELRFE